VPAQSSQRRVFLIDVLPGIRVICSVVRQSAAGETQQNLRSAADLP